MSLETLAETTSEFVGTVAGIHSPTFRERLAELACRSSDTVADDYDSSPSAGMYDRHLQRQEAARKTAHAVAVMGVVRAAKTLADAPYHVLAGALRQSSEYSVEAALIRVGLAAHGDTIRASLKRIPRRNT